MREESPMTPEARVRKAHEFAKVALQGLLSNPAVSLDSNELVIDAWELADMMLAEESKRLSANNDGKRRG